MGEGARRKNSRPSDGIGGQHNETKNQIKDDGGTKYMLKQGIKIIRFWNNEIIGNIEGVGQKLLELLK